MSVMERRLQLLLDAERYGKVADEAQRSGRSVAAVIREAIDRRFPPQGAEARASAAAGLLALTEDAASDPGESPAVLKEAYAAELAAKAGRQ